MSEFVPTQIAHIVHISHAFQGECNRLVCSKRELETMVTEMKACNEDLRNQLDDKRRKCHDTEVTLALLACATGTN